MFAKLISKSPNFSFILFKSPVKNLGPLKFKLWMTKQKEKESFYFFELLMAWF